MLQNQNFKTDLCDVQSYNNNEKYSNGQIMRELDETLNINKTGLENVMSLSEANQNE